jgi:hypothetical protein
VGPELGNPEGLTVGSLFGVEVGTGDTVGLTVGAKVGVAEGRSVGAREGEFVGLEVDGAVVGRGDGAAVGDVVGGAGLGTMLGVLDRTISEKHLVILKPPVVQSPRQSPLKQFPSGDSRKTLKSVPSALHTTDSSVSTAM